MKTYKTKCATLLAATAAMAIIHGRDDFVHGGEGASYAVFYINPINAGKTIFNYRHTAAGFTL